MTAYEGASASILPVEAEALHGPPVPSALRDTGLSREAIIDLTLKTLYIGGARTGRVLAHEMRLPFQLIDDIVLDLQHWKLVHVRGTVGEGRAGYVFDLTSMGRERAREALELNTYVGPAPVPLATYREWVANQAVDQVHVTRETIRDGFRELVLRDEFVEQVGPAINSAKSMFLYGESGNGKTIIAECISRMLGGDIFVPYAIELGGHIIQVYDPVYHAPVDGTELAPTGENGDEPAWLEVPAGWDQRFARVHRPVVFAGGELSLSELDLQYDTLTRYYQAPFQLKANGGVLIIDDLGRQMVQPHDLLNRWIVPLEKRVDYLTLHTGHKFPVPFDCLVVFATNLDPLELVDEAFLRRIHYKILVSDPDHEQYQNIFRRCCEAKGIEFNPAGVRYVFERFYGRFGISPRCCHPRDIVDHLCDVARFLDRAPVLTAELLDRACESYFLDMPDPLGP